MQLKKKKKKSFGGWVKICVVVVPNVVMLVGLACPSDMWKVSGRVMLNVIQAFLYQPPKWPGCTPLKDSILLKTLVRLLFM